MRAYIIKYFRKGAIAEILPFLFPDGKKVIVAEDSSKAIEQFRLNHDEKDFEIFDIRGVQ
jgi:hypothetical protein